MIEKKSKEVQPCIFPFNYLGQTFNKCTILRDQDDKSWCSTKVDEDGNHDDSGGYWGHCGQDCVEKDQSVLKSEFSMSEGNIDLFLHVKHYFQFYSLFKKKKKFGVPNSATFIFIIFCVCNS